VRNTEPALNLIEELTDKMPVPPAHPVASTKPTALLHKAIVKVLVPVSLWALFTAALPGLGGLVIVTAFGVRIGYRQAKAGIMIRTTGLAHAGPGPLGIVRSETFIELHRRRLQPVPIPDGPPVLNQAA